MQPNERPSFAEGLTTTPQVRPGELTQTARLPITMSHVHHGSPPRVRVRS
jgi:hypothetical protein